MKSLPAPGFPALTSLVTADGVRLDADLYYPDPGSHPPPWPVLLMRQPYGRAIASTVVYAHPAWYAAQGYLVVIQDVRGRGTSQGEFRLFAHEEADGVATVQWAAQLPGSTGRVGMYGFSYQGMTQLYAAMGQCPALVTLCPAMVGYDLARDWAYEGGALAWQTVLGWALQLATETARRRGEVEAFGQLRHASQNLPLDSPVPLRPKVLQQFAPDSFYWDWLNNTDPDGDYWQRLRPDLRSIDLPMLHIGGWFDTYLRGTLRLYHDRIQRSKTLQHLWIGPWGHLPWGRWVGGVDFGVAAVSPLDRVQVQWFDYWLKNKEWESHPLEQPVVTLEPQVRGPVVRSGLSHPPFVPKGTPRFNGATAPQFPGFGSPVTLPPTPEEPKTLAQQLPVSLFEMGSNRWRSLSSWPRGGNVVYYFCSSHAQGLGAIVGGLLYPWDTRQDDYPPLEQLMGRVPDRLVHDPWRPVPALGGHSSIPAGSFDRRALDDRADVLTYTTMPLTMALTVAGDLHLTVIASSPAASFDLSAVLSVVRPQGVFCISHGYHRVFAPANPQPGHPLTLTLSLQATCHGFQPGEQIRLSLSGASFPAYDMNPGVAAPPSHVPLVAAQVIPIAVYGGYWEGTLIATQ